MDVMSGRPHYHYIVMPRTAIQILTPGDALARLKELRSRQPVNYFAFYSSQLGGIVTDPALMVLPFDDHIVHRGHGIFDTAGLVDGRIYDLEAHLDRFLLSAERSKLRISPSREEMRDIIVKTVAASGKRNGSIRYWLSSGPGSLELTPAAGSDPGFFVMVFAGLVYPDRWLTQGARVMTTTYPIKAPIYAITKATNYLPNVLMQMEAKAAGFDTGVFIDVDGHVGEGSNMNVAFVTTDAVLVHPRFDHILAGCTSVRLLELAKVLLDQGLLKGIDVRDVSVDEARASREMLLLGSSVKVVSIVQWDDRVIGDGKPGPVAKALLQLLEEDMRTGDRLIDVPY
jgi:4-amino-4-deoxychorismate lyase